MTKYEGKQLGNYRLIKLLGRGGFAEVYLGKHVYLESQAAIKVLSSRLTKESLEGFLSEARILVRLNHPHIVRVLDFGVHDDVPYIVMDYAPRGSLRDLHPQGTRLPISTVVGHVKQITVGLQYAHNENFIHRDIKPENMLLGRNNEVLLSDFGLVLKAHSSGSLTLQEMAGTVSYSAPEQLLGMARKASDQYSLAIVVFEWLSGTCPFEGTSFEIATQHLHAAPPSLREKNPMITPMVEEVVLTALAKEPRQRFAQVQAFTTALEQAYLAELGENAPALEKHQFPAHAIPGIGNAVIDRQGDANYLTTQSSESSGAETVTMEDFNDSTGERLVAADYTPSGASSGSIFQFSTQLNSADDFYGRAGERETLLNRTYHNEATSIVGPRRIGKTWLVRYLILVAHKKLGSRYRIGYVDATMPGCATVAGFTSRVLKELGVSHDSDSANLGLIALEQAIDELKAKGQRPILCIDEFDHFDNRQVFDLHFFTGLRALAYAGLGLVIASKNPLIDIVGDYGKTSGFFNIFEQLTLEPFTEEEAEEFIQAKSTPAGFTALEREWLLRYGQAAEGEWPPIRLQLVGKMLLDEIILSGKEGRHSYRPDAPDYRQRFERRLEEKYRGVVH
jgi:serine/threonine protein kinase